jgi:ABC-type polysaccharide/polyol phosphate export permease
MLVLKHIRDYWRRRHLLWTLVVFDLKHKYTGSVMGVYWSVINPVVLLIIYTFVFSTVLRVEFHQHTGPYDFALYLFCGMIPWFATQESLSRCATCLIDHANLVNMPRFPASFVPAHIILSNMLHNILSIILLIAVVGMFTGKLSSTLWVLPFVIFLQLLLTLGLCWLVSGLNVLFRDLQHMIGNVLLIWMFMTPIFYPSAIFPKEFELLLIFNPMAHLVDNYRELIMKNNVPWESLETLAVLTLGFFIVGYVTFVKVQPSLTDLV